MNRWIRKNVSVLIVIALLLSLCSSIGITGRAYAADEYDTLRNKWKVMLTGGTGYHAGDPDIATQLAAITAKAQSNWDTMDDTPTAYLWSDLTSNNESSEITSGYVRLKEMALGYASYGSGLYQNEELLEDILTGLDWMHVNRYNSTKTIYGNWWDWGIGSPRELNDATVLLYEELTSTQISNYMDAVGHFKGSVTMTGANRVWESTIIAVRGGVMKDAGVIASGRNGLTEVLDYVTSGDGFYRDGSFVQHNYYAYNGGYGKALLGDLSRVMGLLEGSTWTVTAAGKPNVYSWVYEAFEPLIHKGGMMDMTRGREISRHYTDSHKAGHDAIHAIIRLSEFAPPADAARMKSMVKAWLQEDTYRNFYANAPVRMIVLGKAIAADPQIPTRAPLTMYRQFAAMDRAVLHRPDFSFAVSSHSSRIANYESINSENLRGWYTGEGMTYLYNNDLSQYVDGFWPTVNAYRLPGTTVQQSTSVGGGFRSGQNWVGGTELDGIYGMMGMELLRSGSLAMKKSWFMLDEEVVALGAGISGTNGKVVETIVENRKLRTDGANALTVNGSAKSSALGWSESMTGVNWAHLAGNVPGSDIGYYFPNPASLRGLRQARTGAWSQIDSRSTTPTASITRNYLTLWFDHGANPTGAGYAYVLLPGKSAAQVEAYSANPNITILENSATAQAVRAEAQQVTGINFWTDAVKAVGGVTSNKKASVMLRESGTELELSVSDPTQANTGTIQLELDRSASGIHSADAGVTVTQLSPTVKLTVAVNGAKGKTFKVSLNLDDHAEIVVDNPLTERSGAWTASTHLPNYYGADYVYTRTSGTPASIRWRPQLPEEGLYAVYYALPDGNTGRPTNAPYTVHYDGGSQTYAVNQQPVPGGAWILLGTHSFAAGSAGYVELTNQANGTYVNADAVKFVRVE